MKYSIYQILNPKTVSYTSANWEQAKWFFNPCDYKKIYTSLIGIEQPMYALGKLFQIFTRNLPFDYTGRKLGTGDIIRLEINGTGHYYYCNNFSWKEITSTLEEIFAAYSKEKEMCYA